MRNRSMTCHAPQELFMSLGASAMEMQQMDKAARRMKLSFDLDDKTNDVSGLK